MSNLRCRRRFLICASATLASPIAVLAQQKLPTVALLWNDSVKPSPIQVSLLKALGDKGYADGGNIRIVDRISLTGYGPMAASAAELARARVSVIVTFGATATLAAAKATTDIPIVMIAGIDPVKTGLAASMSHPGKNVTGVTLLSAELQAKRVQLLKELVPGLKRIGVLFAPEGGAAGAFGGETEDAARRMELTTHVAEVRKIEDLEGAFASMSAAHVQAAIGVPSSLLAAHAERVTRLAASHRIPMVYSGNRYADAGGLLTYHVDTTGAVARAAGYIDRILKGASPGDLPIEEPVQFELKVNAKAAEALGLKVPQSILIRADRVIK